MKTDRIELVPLTSSDLELFQAINIHPFVRKFLWDDKVMETQVFVDVLKGVENHFRNDDWGLWKINLSGSSTSIGYAGLWIFFDEPQPQLLYALLPEFAGRGFATEASQLVIDYAFNKLEFNELLASMDKDNLGSVKLCQRLGFSFVEERIVDRKPIVFYKRSRG